jgi:hypothetical protein
MKMRDWRPNRRVLILSGGVGATSQRDRGFGMTTEVEPTCDGVQARCEVRLDNGCLATVSIARVQYVTECV